MTANRIAAAGAILLAVGIGIGAMGAHALRDVLTARQLESLDTAVDYQLLNALGLVLIGLLIRSGLLQSRWPAALVGAGVLCFSGGIYLMLGGAPGWLGLVTPVGGVLLMAGWVAVAGCLLMKKTC